MPPANDHYYTAEPSSDHRPGEVRFCYGGRELVFATDSGVFSRRELDRGTEVLLAALPEPVSGPVLDMGCGYGTIGVAVGARWPGLAVTMADVNRRACDLARENARRNGVRAEVLESDGYMALTGRRFATILQNPPIRAGKAVIYRMIADGAASLLLRSLQGRGEPQKEPGTYAENEKENGGSLLRFALRESLILQDF